MNWVDPLGLDVRLGNTNAAGGLHKKVEVDAPNGNTYSQSFGPKGSMLGAVPYILSPPDKKKADAFPLVYPWGENNGVVYQDDDPMIDVEDTLKTNPAQDDLIRKWLRDHHGVDAPYNGWRSCRDYSEFTFDTIKQMLLDGKFDDKCDQSCKN